MRFDHQNNVKAILLFVAIFGFASSCGNLSFTGGNTSATMIFKSSTGSSLQRLAKSNPNTFSTQTCKSGYTCKDATNMSGEATVVTIMISGNGSNQGDGGPDGYALSVIAPNDDARQRPDLPDGSSASVAFDLSSPTPVSGKLMCCGGPEGYVPDDRAITTSVMGMYKYLDITFNETTLGSRTVRVVFTEVSSMGYKRGDLLVKNGANFEWCDSGGCSTTRPSSPYQESSIANYSFPSEGNKNIVPYAVTITDPIKMTESDVIGNNWSFTLSFIQSSVVALNSSVSITSNATLLQAFTVNLSYGDQGKTVGPTATISATKTPI